MTSKTDAWMPLWIGAYLADTQHLSRDEHGGYMLLLMAYWRAGGPLPDDDKRLSAIAKASLKEWKTLRPTLAEFFSVAGGCWTHKRVEQELAESALRKDKAQSKARAAADARWKKDGKHSSSNAPGNAPSIPQALHEECPTPSPTPIPSLRSGKGARSRTPGLARPDEVTEATWADFLALRQSKKAPVTATVVTAARKEADKAGMTLQRFLEVWCLRGSQGLHAEWLKPEERRSHADVARTTVPGSSEPDPALLKIKADAARAVPPPAEVRERLASLRKDGKAS